VECTPEYLLQFAFMGSYYAEGVLGVASPRVGLLNNGTERTKGTALQIATYDLLEKAGRDGMLRFIGNVEGREIMLGACDVVVCDGFSGNILLKSLEGAATFIISELRGIFMKNPKAKFSALLVKKGVRALREKMDPDKVGGTALLGISKPVVKAHGSSNARAVLGAILQAESAAHGAVADKLQSNIDMMRLDGP
jgi:glycerol-3-phosphate acyltransferase PlsX